MIINDNNIEDLCMFEEIEDGEAFQYKVNDWFITFIKTTHTNTNGQRYCVKLLTGEVFYLNNNDLVKRINAKVVIE